MKIWLVSGFACALLLSACGGSGGGSGAGSGGVSSSPAPTPAPAPSPSPAPAPSSPAITTPPVDQAVMAGTSATFKVAATGPSLLYQWQRNGVAIPGATTASHTIPAAGSADDAAIFSV